MLESSPEAGFRRFLTHENLAATASVGVGAVLAMGGGLLTTLIATDTNYKHSGFLEGMIEILLAVGALYVTGAYLGAGAPWAVSSRERDYSPALMALGGAIGGMVSLAVVGPLTMWFDRGLSTVGAMAGAWGLARLACKVQVRKPTRSAFRWARLVTVALAGFGVAISLMLPRDSFPGAQAPMADRRAWAVKTFDSAYTNAETYLLQQPEVKAQLGAIEAMAPTEGENHTAYSPGELMGVFTIEIKGAKGTGKAFLQFMHGSSDPGWKSYGFNGKLETPSGTTNLD